MSPAPSPVCPTNGTTPSAPSPAELVKSVRLWVFKYGYRMARKYRLEDPDAFVADCLLRVLEKADQFDPAKGRATSWISTAIWRLARREAANQRRRPHAVSLFAEDRHGRTFADAAFATPDTSGLEAVEIARVHEAVNRLPARLRDVVRWRYGLADGPALNAVEIGRRLGVTGARVFQLLESAKKMLYRSLRLHPVATRRASLRPAARSPAEPTPASRA